MRELVTVRGEAAGVKGLHPHRFRHTSAHDYLMTGDRNGLSKHLAGRSSDADAGRYGASAADLRAREGAGRLRRGDRV